MKTAILIIISYYYQIILFYHNMVVDCKKKKFETRNIYGNIYIKKKTKLKKANS